jgi:CBS domain-containing protein
MNPSISTLMQRPVFSVNMDDTVAQVEALLVSKHLSWVPVLDPLRKEVIGVISASDIVSFHDQGRHPAATRAWQMCTYKPIVVDIGTPVGMVAALMLERGVHHVIVTDREGLAGAVSSLDFVRTFLPTDSRSHSRP